MSEALALPAPGEQSDLRELAHRFADKLEVFLWWHERSNVVEVSLYDFKEDTVTVFPVPPERALDAFNHPYAYAPDAEVA
jgi:hypothetical protein